MTLMDYTSLPDEALMILIVRGQEDALGTLYDRYSRIIYSIGLSITNDPEAAQEITQDVFMRAWERGGTYLPDQGKVSTWLIRIARNRSIDFLRWGKSRQTIPMPEWEDPFPDSMDGDSHIEGMVEQAQQHQRLRWAVAQLSPDQKQVLNLAYFQGLTHQQIASATGIPLGTVKTRLRLGMQRIKLLLEVTGTDGSAEI